MLTKNELKYYSNLLRKKYRLKENKFLVEGRKILEEALSSSYNCELVCATSSFIDSNNNLIDKISERNIRLEVLKNNELDKLSDTKTPQGVVAVFDIRDKNEAGSYYNRIIVMLDNINDPGNLGTIIRTCDWFGINELVLSNSTADIYNPKVIRSTMGSLFHIDSIRYGVLSAELQSFKKKGYRILATDLKGESIYRYQKETNIVLVLSNEAHGFSEEINEYADSFVTIPRIGKAESLNVASAAAVIISEITRR